MNFNLDTVRKALACCALLPPPGDEVARQLAEDWLDMYAQLERFPAPTHVPKEETP